MSTADETAENTLALPERLVPPLERGQKLFRAALIVALLLHAAFFVEVGRSVPRAVGDRSGSPDAIAVDIVTAADLASRETVALPPPGAPSETPPQQSEPQPKPQPAEPAEQPSPPDPPQAAPKPPETKPPAEQPKAQEPALLPDFESTLPDLATIPQPSESDPAESEKPKPKEPEPAPSQEKSTPAKKKPQKQARLDPSEPALKSAPPGRSASATRPPGITRSGENDEFGRGVVRALRMTMPPPRGIFGRVTVRLILTENGDLGDVQILDASGTPIDQSVVFATRQTYFPLPPYKSTLADRTFIITYVYR